MAAVTHRRRGVFLLLTAAVVLVLVGGGAVVVDAAKDGANQAYPRQETPQEAEIQGRRPGGWMLEEGLPPIYNIPDPTLSLEDVASTSKDDGGDRWIIVWRPTGGQAASESYNKFNGTCTFTYKSVIQGVAVTLDQSNLRAFLQMYKSSVLFAEADALITIKTTTRQYNPIWGLDRINQHDLPLDKLYSYTSDGTGVNAYIVDTGIRASHVQFKDSKGNSRAQVAFDAINESAGYGVDCNGHGTHVAGTVGGQTFGVAKNVTIWGVKGLNCLGSGLWSQITAGLDWVRTNGKKPNVVNMSIGGAASSSVDLAIQQLVASGTTVVVAAGNDNADACLSSPAREPTAITVAASDYTDTRASFSNWGTCVDVYGPVSIHINTSGVGVDIMSGWYDADNNNNTISGTSMATPHVVNTLYLSANPSATPTQVTSAITDSATWNKIKSNVDGTTNRLLFSLLTLPPATVSPKTFTASESDPAQTVSFTLSSAPTSTVTVTVTSARTDKLSISPSTFTISTVSWSTTQSVSLTPIRNYIADGDVSFDVMFTLTSSDVNFQFAVTVTATITDADMCSACGDTISNPKVITYLPFSYTGSTTNYNDTYDVACDTASTAPDVVFMYTPPVNLILDVSTCGGGNYDTKIFIFMNNANTVVGCNDDGVGCDNFKSLLTGVSFLAGNNYYIVSLQANVVDGYQTESGTYLLNVTLSANSPPLPTPPPPSLTSSQPPPPRPPSTTSTAITTATTTKPSATFPTNPTALTTAAITITLSTSTLTTALIAAAITAAPIIATALATTTILPASITITAILIASIITNAIAVSPILPTPILPSIAFTTALTITVPTNITNPFTTALSPAALVAITIA
eukprot:jgi/Chlat1/4133/Chrsp269S03964